MSMSTRFVLALSLHLCIAHCLLAQEHNVQLWDDNFPIPKVDELESLKGVTFHVIKEHEPEVDGGYGFLHGVALAWHRGKLYASWGHNKGKENTASEEARGRVSTDGGRTWSETFTIDLGDSAGGLAVSHGVFLVHADQLWALMGAFHGVRQNVHTRAYVLDNQTGNWKFRGVIAKDGFWPMEEPVQLKNGNWLMGGLIVGQGNPAGVAISHGEDILNWSVTIIPKPELMKMWGESTTFISGNHITNISRYGEKAIALASHSNDFGRTWSEVQESNLPMVTSKPYAGTLSTGQRYLVATNTANTGGRRAPLTIAISKIGEDKFSRIFKIRDAIFPEGPGDSHPNANLAYPYAIEHEGKLYIGYSNSGGRPGMNINSAELAIIPITSLSTD